MREIETRLIAKGAAGFGQVGFGPILRKAIWVLKIVGRQICFECPIELGNNLVKGPGFSGSNIEHAGVGAGQGFEVGLNHIIDVDKIAPLLACIKNARSLAGAHLFCELVNHAGKFAFVVFAGAVDIGVAQGDDRMRQPRGVTRGQSLHCELAERVNIQGIGSLGFAHWNGAAAVDAATARPDDAGICLHGPIQYRAECFHVVAQHLMLKVLLAEIRPTLAYDAGDAGLVEKAIEFSEAGHRLDILRVFESQHVAGEVDEIGIGGGQERIGDGYVVTFFGQMLGEIRADESSAAGDENSHWILPGKMFIQGKVLIQGRAGDCRLDR